MISKRYDDVRKSGSITVSTRRYDHSAVRSTGEQPSPTMAVVYYIDGISESRTNEGYAEFTFNIKEYENCSSVTTP